MKPSVKNFPQNQLIVVEIIYFFDFHLEIHNINFNGHASKLISSHFCSICTLLILNSLISYENLPKYNNLHKLNFHLI